MLYMITKFLLIKFIIKYKFMTLTKYKHVENIILMFYIAKK